MVQLLTPERMVLFILIMVLIVMLEMVALTQVAAVALQVNLHIKVIKALVVMVVRV